MGFAGGLRRRQPRSQPTAASAGRESPTTPSPTRRSRIAEHGRAASSAPQRRRREPTPQRDAGQVSRPAVGRAAGHRRLHGAENRTRRQPRRSAAAPSAADPAACWCARRPPARAVSVDGTDYGPTPATVRDLAHGAHRVRVTHDGYAAEERRVVITSSRPVAVDDVAMLGAGAAPTRALAAPAPPAASRRPAASPARWPSIRGPTGAKVFIDGKLVGTTPLALPIGGGRRARDPPRARRLSPLVLVGPRRRGRAEPGDGVVGEMSHGAEDWGLSLREQPTLTRSTWKRFWHSKTAPGSAASPPAREGEAAARSCSTRA